MGFLVESHLDEDGIITMYVCFVSHVLDDKDPFCYRTERYQITEENIGLVSNDERLFSWTKNNVVDDNFMLFYESQQLSTIYDSNYTILREKDKRLYRVVDFELFNIELKEDRKEFLNIESTGVIKHGFIIRDDTNRRYHYFESLGSFEELSTIVSESFTLE